MTLFTCFCEVTLSFSTTLVLDPEDKNLIFELSTAEAEQMKICQCCLTSYNFGQSLDHITEFDDLNKSRWRATSACYLHELATYFSLELTPKSQNLMMSVFC